MIVTSFSHASRCTASLTGVRPIPTRSLSIASDQRLPGGNSSVTMSSSSLLCAMSASLSGRGLEPSGIFADKMSAGHGEEAVTRALAVLQLLTLRIKVLASEFQQISRNDKALYFASPFNEGQNLGFAEKPGN